jgi:hypothetical protein
MNELVRLRLAVALVGALVCGCGDPAPGEGLPDGGGGVASGDGGADDGPAGPVGSPRIAFSEIMYHPVLANQDDNRHEFIELTNTGNETVDLGGWSIAGEVRLTFPTGTALASGQQLVVARDRAALLALPAHGLAAVADRVVGDYAGALDDGGGALLLLDSNGNTVDHVRYDDAFPWPLAADGFGAGEGWFEPAEWFPPDDPRRSFSPHRYLGHSLERVSFTVPGTEVANWVASPLDGATPGRANTTSGQPPAIVEQLNAGPVSDPALRPIRPRDKVLVRARLTEGSPIANVQLEYWIEFDRARRLPAGAPATRLPMVAGPLGYEATLPALPARTLVRYRILGERTPGSAEVLSPRPGDPIPYGAFAYYVSPDLGGKPHYEILISSESWGRMWSNIFPDGSVKGCSADYLDEPCRGCEVNPSWNARVPAVVVFAGEPYDVRARYQGSMEGRTEADDISDWPSALPRPTTGPLRAMSWSLALPRYRRLEGQSRLLLNRLNQSCPGFSHALAAALDEDPRGGAIPAPRVRRWARVFVNGGAYSYMMDLEPIREEYLERFYGKGQPIGDVYKIFSTGGDHGPWAPGTGQVLEASPFCPEIPVRERYEHTYRRKSHEWRSIDELMGLIDDFSAARDAGAEAVRAFLTARFDVDATLKYYAVQQWGVPWDDNGKNYNLYKLPAQSVRPGGGAFTITSWDVDRMFGVAHCPSDEECADADGSLYCQGESTVCNRWKRAFLEALRPEFDAKLRELNETLLLPDNIRRIVDETLARYDVVEANQMLNTPSCEATVAADEMKRFADRRYRAVRMQLGY